ncbi:amino acid permease [Bacillus sp. APMAM]|nr:amino acid permease [Bacillus sp. APMAM]RTZ55854.1 amino acid permease [Bacillus sp. SAJ1]
MSNETHLKKNVGFLLSVSIVIGTVIGSGIFMKPGIVLSSTGTTSKALLAWVIGGIITLASGLTIAEVSVKIPKTGGLYAYLEDVYGKLWGFLCGWVQSIIYGPAIIGALGLYFGTLIAGFFGWPDHTKILIGIMTVILLCVLNLLGTQYGGIIQNISTIAKLVPIVLVAVFGIWKGGHPIFAGSVHSDTINFGAAVLATLYAYDGWMNVGFMAGEMKNPAKTLPRAIIFGIVIVIIAYLTVNMAMFHTLSAQQIIDLGPNAAKTAATILFGGLGGKLIAIGIMISIFGCLNGKILTFPRITLAMANTKLLPGSKAIAKIHPKYQTPIGATVIQVLIAILMMLFGNPDRLSDLAIFTVFIFYSLAFYAVFLLRKQDKGKETKGLYKVPLYPVTPILAIIGSAYIVINTLISSPLDAVISIGITLIGLVVYLVRKSKVQS